MLISDAERSNIIFKSIQEYKPGENDFSILISVKIIAAIIKNKDQFGQIDAQDIYKEIEDTFDFFNDFIKERKIDLPEIPEDHKELVKEMMNQGMGYNKTRLDYVRQGDE